MCMGIWGVLFHAGCPERKVKSPLMDMFVGDITSRHSKSTRPPWEVYTNTVAKPPEKLSHTRKGGSSNSRTEGLTTYQPKKNWKQCRDTGHYDLSSLQHSWDGIILTSFGLGVSQHFGARSPNGYPRLV